MPIPTHNCPLYWDSVEYPMLKRQHSFEQRIDMMKHHDTQDNRSAHAALEKIMMNTQSSSDKSTKDALHQTNSPLLNQILLIFPLPDIIHAYHQGQTALHLASCQVTSLKLISIITHTLPDELILWRDNSNASAFHYAEQTYRADKDTLTVQNIKERTHSEFLSVLKKMLTSPPEESTSTCIGQDKIIDLILHTHPDILIMKNLKGKTALMLVEELHKRSSETSSSSNLTEAEPEYLTLIKRLSISLELREHHSEGAPYKQDRPVHGLIKITHYRQTLDTKPMPSPAHASFIEKSIFMLSKKQEST